MTVVHDLIILPPTGPLVGSVPVPGDPAIAGLLLLAAGLAEGTSEVNGLSAAPDTTAMVAALETLGVSVDAAPKGKARIRGVGLEGMREGGSIDCQGSVRTMRLLAAVLVARPFESVLRGDAAVLGTNIAELARALRGRDARIEGAFSPTEPGKVTAPLVVGPLEPGRRLAGIEYELASHAPDVKDALLLSGLFADESTFVRERIVSRDHAERMLQALDVPVAMVGPIVHLDVGAWKAGLPAFAAQVPGDFSATALLLAAASVVPESRVCVRGTGLNPTRTGLLDLLRQMGGAPEVEIRRSALGEPEGVVCASFAPLHAATMAGETLGRAGGEVFVLAAIAARARGQTEIGDLRAVLGRDAMRTVDRIGSVLKAFDVTAEVRADAVFIQGQPEGALRAADFDSQGEPDAAALATVLGLVGEGPTRVRHVDGLARRFPRFVGTLRALGVDARVEERTV